MALFRPGPLAQTVSGAIGGVVFAQGKGGSYVKTRGSKTNQRSTVQGQNRGRFLEIVRAWDLMLPAKQQLWAALGVRTYRVDRVGVQKPWGGRALFLSEGMIKIRVGMSVVPDPPIKGVRQPFASFTVTYTGGVLTLRGTRPTGFTAGNAIFYGCRAMSRGGFSSKSPQVFLRSPFSTNLVVNATSFFANKFGTPAVGEWILIRCVVIFDDCLSALPVDVQLVRAS